MATQETSSSQNPIFPLDSYDTALCIVPPRHLWSPVDHLRSVYDPAYKKWPPHVNLVYPFVPVHNLQAASELIVSKLRSHEGLGNLNLHICSADRFVHKSKKTTFFVYDNGPQTWTDFIGLRKYILEALHQKPTHFEMHMTVGQSKESLAPPNDYILRKAEMLPALQWKVNKIYILIRDRDENKIDLSVSSEMKIWGEIDLGSMTLMPMREPMRFYNDEKMAGSLDGVNVVLGTQALTRLPYTFSPRQYKWVTQQINLTPQQGGPVPESLSVASYNIQAEFEYPPSRARYPIVIQNIQDGSALADVLVLQEVTDDFLSYLCKDEDIRKVYPFISDGPADQSDIEPISDHSNIAVLSKWPFSWDLLLLPSLRGSVIVQFNHIGKHEKGVFLPVILSAVHFTSGLTDKSVTKKRDDLESLLKYLSGTYSENPWILAGDFNITTSMDSIEVAIRRKDITTDGRNSLVELEAMLTGSGLMDSWTAACIEHGDSSRLDQTQQDTSEALGGEQGATFDPKINNLASNLGRGDFSERPQRYDRILVKRNDILTVTSFNMFGQNIRTVQTEFGLDIDSDALVEQYSYGSDHWGVRCLFNVSNDVPTCSQSRNFVPPVQLNLAPAALADVSTLAACLSLQSVYPSEIDIAIRETAFDLLKEVVVQGEDNHTQGLPALVVIPVGSYGLGAWTTSSDINCLCIGPISSKTFFTLAIQRLRKAASRGVKILRSIDTNTDSTLKLEVGHVKMDLRYCSAVTITETWPAALTLPPTNPMFNLPSSVLVNLKPMRDLYYLRQTIPDLAAFKLAYQFVVCWAKQRGIYAPKLGYLGGIQISILLSRVCKLLSYEGGFISAPTILTSFFHHYANFDWERNMVFDPFFHKNLRYVRTAREPMVVLGFHGPSLNTAQAASVPTVRVISKEFNRIDALLSELDMEWSYLLRRNTGAAEFLYGYNTYAKITARFWSVPLARGGAFLDWFQSQCIFLFNVLSKQVPHLNPRIWPARFVSREYSAEESTEYEGHYLVGFEIQESHPLIVREDMKVALAQVQATLYQFRTQVTNDTKYFDANSFWVDTDLVPDSGLGQLKVDDRDWGKYTLEAEDDEMGDLELWASTEQEASEPRTKKDSTTRLPRRSKDGVKLRSAGDVLNRLRWDPATDSSDYIVVYEDRFSGTMERSVDSWKSDTTHEEFIPEHRIMCFKRKSDGTIVWDRAEKLDQIFGSGVNVSRV
ncbi:uncharacterized protein F4822DRAFT_424432 [Hypoxylon trugodes]|uniref:uncharacterized protein n=1 Tax=Hypoxylon trugodes TaxID=326681 RepID=UPI00219CFCEB|nr:uncharacterized protein F4822DRAFT_424432 [Hypoxylon trugodes]KAI1393974.1 hypothetical protein F4822DRAFT_424432 [Hypoxylon trugodes]